MNTVNNENCGVLYKFLFLVCLFVCFYKARKIKIFDLDKRHFSILVMICSCLSPGNVYLLVILSLNESMQREKISHPFQCYFHYEYGE